MPSVHETAYLRLKSSITTKELTDLYTPTPLERRRAAQHLVAPQPPDQRRRGGGCPHALAQLAPAPDTTSGPSQRAYRARVCRAPVPDGSDASPSAGRRHKAGRPAPNFPAGERVGRSTW